MLKVTLECNNVQSENIAEILSEFTDTFNIWFHDGALYAFFNLKFLEKLFEISKKLESIQGIEFRYIKIQKVKRLWMV